ncbi:flagellar basal body-associated protein FliL [Paenibacillus sp. PastF-3]|nr:flagellar basal body-associated protein FliL [Paenibacillus sp. PastF-3]
MRKLLLLKGGLLPIVLTLYCLLCSGCSVIRDKPAKEDLSLALAGMAGSDEVVFEGANMLTRGGTTVPESLLFYGGTVQDHKKVKLYTLLPDKSTIQKTAAGGVKDLKSNAYAMKPYYSQLEKKEGRWELQTTENSSEEGNPLPALNPLKQLEELESMEKSVTEEAGAGRGTSVLRIELTPSEARKQLSAELEKEMQNLRPKVSESAENNAEADQAVTEALEKLWQKKNNELQQKLKQANVETVYHLTVDKKHNLPRRLTLNRKVSYSGEMMNKSENETYVSKVDFTGYR